MPKILLMTSPRIDCRWLAHRLCQSIDLDMVVFQQPDLSFANRVAKFKKKCRTIAPLLLPWNWGKLLLLRKVKDVEARVRRGTMALAPREDRQLARSELPVPTRAFADLNSPEAIAFLREQKPDLILTFAVAILRPPVIEIPRLGIINAHPAMLPRYRGSKAITFQLINEDYDATGVTIHFIDPGIDTGDIVLQRHEPSGPEDTPTALYYRILVLMSELLAEAAKQILAGTATRTPQPKTDQHATRRAELTPELQAKLYRRLGLM